MGLPNKPFLINFNAQNYDPATATFLREEGQLVDWDATLTNGSAAPVLSEDGKYVTTNSCSATKMFSSTNQNPFNRNSSAKSITIIYKFREPVSSSGSDIFINRTSTAYNYMVRDNVFHTTNSSFLQLTRRLNEADTYYIRIQADGNSEKVNVSTGQRVTASSVSYGLESNGVALFREYANMLGAVWSGDFYYIYISLL